VFPQAKPCGTFRLPRSAAACSVFTFTEGPLYHPDGFYYFVDVRGDPSGRRFRADIWWYIHFFNRWGDLAAAHPTKVLVVRYEIIQNDPEAALRCIAEHLRVKLDKAAIDSALLFASRDAIRAALDPTDTEIIVPDDGTNMSIVYGPRDEAFMWNVFVRYLRHDFGYSRAAPSGQTEPDCHARAARSRLPDSIYTTKKATEFSNFTR
jgi:hypothetical protein